MAQPLTAQCFRWINKRFVLWGHSRWRFSVFDGLINGWRAANKRPIQDPGSLQCPLLPLIPFVLVKGHRLRLRNVETRFSNGQSMVHIVAHGCRSFFLSFFTIMYIILQLDTRYRRTDSTQRHLKVTQHDRGYLMLWPWWGGRGARGRWWGGI